jgi:hypothetical protein
VLNRLSTTLLARFVALAMTLTVAFHAAQPVGAPVERVSGSAFSAATSDVAVAPDRREAARKVVLVARLDAPPVALTRLPMPVALGPAQPYVLPPATGPPSWPALAWGPSPGAPPLS